MLCLPTSSILRGVTGLWNRRCCALALALLAAGCEDEPARITLELCGDVEVPEILDAVRIIVLHEDRSPSSEGVFELAPAEGPGALPGEGPPARGAAFDGSVVAADAGPLDAGAADGGAPVVPSCGGATLSERLRVGAGDGLMWIAAVGLRDGAEVMRVEVRGASGATARLPLVEACLGVTCPLGQTCIGGTCGLVPAAHDEGACVSPPPDGGCGAP